MKRVHEEVLPSITHQLPLEIWIEIFKHIKNPLISLYALSLVNKNKHNLLSLHAKRQQLLSYGIQQIALSNRANFTYFLDTKGCVFVYGDYDFYYGHFKEMDANQLDLMNQYPYHLSHFTSLNNIQKIIRADDSFESTFFLNIKGQVFACGENFSGELGIGDITNQYNPKEIRTLKDIKHVVSEGGSTFFLTNEGRVFTCGNNEFGQLGIGNMEDQNDPVEITTLENIEHVITHMGSTFFLNTKGTVFACGDNSDGQLGIGDNLNQNHPIELTSVKNIKQLTSKRGSIFFLDNDGHVFVCGNNEFGQLGVGNTDNQNHPIQLTDLKNIIQIIPFIESTFFLDNHGQVFACGTNTNGQLGIENIEIQYQPIQLTTLKNIKQMIGSVESLFFLNEDGQVFAHGKNTMGQLGIGNTEDQNESTELTTLKNIEHIVLDHTTPNSKSTFFLNTKQQAFACGTNHFKNLGIIRRNKKPESSPIALSTISDIKQIVAQQSCTFFIDLSGQVFACGDNTHGQLGFEIRKTLDEPTLIPFFVEQKKEHILRLAQKWDIDTLENLVKDKASYSDLCNEVLMEKKQDACMNAIEHLNIQPIHSNRMFKEQQQEHDNIDQDTSNSFDTFSLSTDLFEEISSIEDETMHVLSTHSM